MDLEDPTTQEFLLSHIRVAVILSSIILPVVGLYYLATPDGPNRWGLGIAIAFAIALTFSMHRLMPWKRILSSPLGLWALGGWTGSTIVLIEIAAALDGGPTSPIAWLVAVPLIAGSMSYPPRGVLGLGALSVVGHLCLALTSGQPLGPVTLLQAVILAIIAAMCAMTSANHRRTAAQLRRTARDLEELATTDGLTGCANHRAFQEHLRRQVSTAHRDGRDLSLLLVDLDHFKKINDTYGHPVGDEVLRAVGARLRGSLRSGDLVGRIGGEEFAVLLPDTPLDVALQVAERGREIIGAIDEPVALTASVGVSSLPLLAANAEDLLSAADRGLYRAKNSGRDRVVVADRDTGAGKPDPDGDLQARVRRVLEDGLLRALFQPVMDLRSEAVVGYEALARVDGSNMAPAGWLDLAAGSGLRHELETAMWDAALEAWSAAAPADGLALWLNISPAVLVGGLPWTRREHLPANVVLELSELASVVSYAQTRRVVDEWRARGVRVAIDDVGAGHANMQHVVELLPDIIKLDRALIHDVAIHPAKQAMIRGVVNFSRDMGSVLVAEGVEDARCAETLIGLGVDLAQGWHYGRPSDLPTALSDAAQRSMRYRISGPVAAHPAG